jgi:hypothetical protein
MPGLATRLLIAELVLKELRREDPALFDVINNPDNQKWYMLGALGPAIGDCIPHQSGGLGAKSPRSPYFSIWQQVFQIAVGNSQLNPPLPGLVPTLQTLLGIMNKLATLVNNHDFSGTKALRDSGELDKVNQASKDLGTILNFFSQTDNLAPIASLICPGSQPAIDNPTRLVPPSQWTGRDWLHWKRPGAFATALRDSAVSWAAAHPGDNRFVAYAAGWQVAYAALVCGSGFMNSIAGSCYRTLWWRHRWLQLFVDTWSWGYYGAGASYGDDGNPNPPYEKWPALCAAGLHNLIDLTNGLDPQTVAETVVTDGTLPGPLPDDFVTFWLDSWSTAYSNPSTPLFTADRLQAGFLMTWLVLWFQTSGDVVGCNPAPSPTPPSSCGDNPTPPDWIDPTQTNPATCKPDGTGCQPFAPQEPTPEHDPTVGEIICGAILAVAGVVSLFFGGGIIGVGAIAGGVGLMVDGEEQLNWDQLNCQIYWLNVYIYNGLSALHKLTVLAGIQQPYPADLAQMSESLKFGGVIPIDFSTTAEMCKSQGLQNMLVTWQCGLLDWRLMPTGVAPETPVSDVWNWPGWWPSAFIDDVEQNPGGADITVAPATYNTGVSDTFGPSVQAALRLIQDPAASLPDWNLDGDRGIGWLTWELQAPYAQPLQTQAET